MKKSYAISFQIINTIKVNNKPWGIQDSSSKFIYGDSVTKNLFALLYNHLITKGFMITNHPKIWDSSELK